MKKILLLFTACAVTLSSCLKNDRFEKNMTDTGLYFYQNVLFQNLMTLDPFNIAFRLNTLIVEGQGDYAAAPQATVEKLFGKETTISYDETTGNYTITYTGTKSDFYRKGEVTVQTNGYATLGENLARWNVSIPSMTPYEMGVTVADMAKLYPNSSSYHIENTADNTWKITTSQFVSSLGEKTETNGEKIEYQSNWNSTYIITQLSGTQTLEDIGKSIFTMTATANGNTMYAPRENQKINVATYVPFKFNPGCSRITPVGEGEMYIWSMDDAEMTSGVSVDVLGDPENKVCLPKTRITYLGYTTEYTVQLE